VVLADVRTNVMAIGSRIHVRDEITKDLLWVCMSIGLIPTDAHLIYEGVTYKVESIVITMTTLDPSDQVLDGTTNAYVSVVP